MADERAAGRTGTQPCSFCSVSGGAQYAHYTVRICDACTGLCREIIDENMPQPLPTARIVTHRKRREP
jgi:hypothetical protein